MKSVKQSVSLFLCTVLLVACSGSDGGSVPPTSAPIPSDMASIDASSAAPIARAVVDAVFAGGKIGDVLVVGGSGSLVGKTDLGSAKAGSALDYFSNVPLQETTPCAVDGSVSVFGEVADPTTLTADDRILLQFSHCDDGAGQSLSGIYEVDVNSFSGDLLQGLVDLDATLTLDGFELREGQQMTSLNGGATLHLDNTVPLTTSVSVVGNSVLVSDNTDAATLTDFRSDVTHDVGVAPEAFTSAASGTLTSTLFEGTVNYSTPVPFMGFAGEYPFSGELLVTGAEGASLRLFALDNTNVRLEVDPGDGSGLISEAMTWGQLASPVIGVSAGIRGQVIRGPIYPGPEIEGEINEEPFSASFSVLDSENNEVAQFVSDENGIFVVELPLGEYTVVPGSSAPILFPEHQTKEVTVPDDGVADVVLEFDTGIR